MAVSSASESFDIREVWNDNLEDEFELIRNIVDDYNYVAMDTEYPGTILCSAPNLKGPSTDYYVLKANVDLLKLIQLGLTFSDEKGNFPTCGTDKYCVWQFNFREFNVHSDILVRDSIVLLHRSGIDFRKNIEKGIDIRRFSELLLSSGVVLNDSVNWVTFHSIYDFAFLVKLLICTELPNTQAEFFDLVRNFFPIIYDVKHLMRFCNGLYGGLNRLAEQLGVKRVGVSHQAGSDSLLTSCTFMKMKEVFFNNGSLDKYAGVLFGLGDEKGQKKYYPPLVQKSTQS